MVTPDEREGIIAEAIERTMLTIPEVIGNLMANHAALHKINMKFYGDFPEFQDKKDVVQSVVEMVEGKNPLLEYKDILKKAVPEIRKRIELTKNMNLTSIDIKIQKDFSSTDIDQNGVI